MVGPTVFDFVGLLVRFTGILLTFTKELTEDLGVNVVAAIEDVPGHVFAKVRVPIEAGKYQWYKLSDHEAWKKKYSDVSDVSPEGHSELFWKPQDYKGDGLKLIVYQLSTLHNSLTIDPVDSSKLTPFVCSYVARSRLQWFEATRAARSTIAASESFANFAERQTSIQKAEPCEISIKSQLSEAEKYISEFQGYISEIDQNLYRAGNKRLMMENDRERYQEIKDIWVNALTAISAALVKTQAVVARLRNGPIAGTLGNSET